MAATALGTVSDVSILKALSDASKIQLANSLINRVPGECILAMLASATIKAEFHRIAEIRREMVKRKL